MPAQNRGSRVCPDLALLHQEVERHRREQRDIERLSGVDLALEVRGKVHRHLDRVPRRALELRADLLQDDLDHGRGQRLDLVGLDRSGRTGQERHQGRRRDGTHPTTWCTPEASSVAARTWHAGHAPARDRTACRRS
jgi:hypothetical protein